MPCLLSAFLLHSRFSAHVQLLGSGFQDHHIYVCCRVKAEGGAGAEPAFGRKGRKERHAADDEDAAAEAEEGAPARRLRMKLPGAGRHEEQVSLSMSALYETAKGNWTVLQKGNIDCDEGSSCVLRRLLNLVLNSRKLCPSRASTYQNWTGRLSALPGDMQYEVFVVMAGGGGARKRAGRCQDRRRAQALAAHRPGDP